MQAAESKLRKTRCGLVPVTADKEGNDSVFSLSSLCMSHRSSRGFFGIVLAIPLGKMRAIPNNFILISSLSNNLSSFFYD